MLIKGYGEMAKAQIGLKVAFRWWAKPALMLAVIAYEIFGKEVPETLIDSIVRHGTRLEIVE